MMRIAVLTAVLAVFGHATLSTAQLEERVSELKPPPTPPPSPKLLKLEQEYGAMMNASCAKVLAAAPDLDKLGSDFMNLYEAYNGTGDQKPVIEAAMKLLTASDVEKFLSAPDSFVTGGLDQYMVQCAVIFQATVKGLAEFAVQNDTAEAVVDRLLHDTLLMRDMLVAGGAKEGKYGEAMMIYTHMINASTVLSDPVPRSVDSAAPWDDRNQSTVLHRALLGTALEHAVPIIARFTNQVVDPVQRYLHYEKAYLAGDLDPGFEVLTAFELRYVTACQSSNDELAWLRKSMPIYRPDHVASSDYHWRYARAVRTDVAYGHPVWPDGRADMKEIPCAGGECGPRAWFGRFSRRAFGLPTWGVKQPGHAAMTTWAPNGWAVLLGADWRYSWWDTRGGDGFHLETQAREFRSEFQNILRGTWVSFARGETPVNPFWSERDPKSYGKGGLWSALMLYAQFISVEVTHPNGTIPRTIGPSVVPTKVASLIKKWNTKLPTPNITTGPDGTIKIPAAAFTAKSRTASIDIMPSWDEGQQILHNGGNFIDPNASYFEYEVPMTKAGTYYLTANITSWHLDIDLQLTTNTSSTPTHLPVFYTVGYWNETQAVEVKMVEGKNVLRFTRQTTRPFAIKELFLLTSKPDIPPPPKNHTPAPAPPPVSSYIELSAGKTCESQGIQELTEKECAIACEYFKFKYTGARQREYFSGCFALEAGEWKGNCNFNANKTAVCCDPDARAICLRGSVGLHSAVDLHGSVNRRGSVSLKPGPCCGTEC